MYELIYTSARQGILPGRSGFCTVACTTGIPPNLIPPVENLSAYKPLFSVGDPQAENNPVSISGRIFTFGQATYQIVSRTGFAGADYTGRTNKISHHFILPKKDLLLNDVPGGMLAIAMAEDNFQTDWGNADPKWLNPRQNIMIMPVLSETAGTWEKYAGDARWAGLAAAAYYDNPSGSLYVEYPLGMPVRDLLKLFSEVVILLPLEEQQLFTFDTYAFQTGISASGCFLRAVPEGTPLLDNIRRHRPEELISLVEKKPFPEYYADNAFVQASQGTKTDSADNPDDTLVLKACPQDEPQKTIQLKKKTPPGKNRAMPVNPVPETKTASEQHQTGRHESGNYKLLFYLTLILLILCVTMFIFLHVMNSNGNAVSEPAEKTPEKEEPTVQTIKSAPEKKPIQPEAETQQKVQSEPKPEAPVKQREQTAAGSVKRKKMKAAATAGKTTGVKQGPAKELRINGEERVYLFMNLYLKPKKQFLLSERLRKCKKVSFTFDKIGDHPVSGTDRSKYTSMTESGMKVFAVSAIREGAKNTYVPFKGSYFSMQIQNGQMIIQNVNTDDKNVINFTMENVKGIRFDGEKESFLWDCLFYPDKDIEYIKSGNLDFEGKELVYKRSQEENIFEKEFLLPSQGKCYLEIKFCGRSDLSEINNFISTWNETLNPYNEANNKLKSFKKKRDDIKCKELSGKELESLKKKKELTGKDLNKIKMHWLAKWKKGEKTASRIEAVLYRKLQKQDNSVYQDCLKDQKRLDECKKEIKDEEKEIKNIQENQAKIKKGLSNYGLQGIVSEQNMVRIAKDTSAGKKLIDAVRKETKRYFVIQGMNL